MIPHRPSSEREAKGLLDKRWAEVIVREADAGKVIWPAGTVVWNLCAKVGENTIFTVTHLALDEVAASVYPPQMTLETFLGKARPHEVRDSDALAAQLERDKPPESSE
jgi:hypothetical protein